MLQAQCSEAAVRETFTRLRGLVRKKLAQLQQRGGMKHPVKAAHVSYAAPRGGVGSPEQPAEASPADTSKRFHELQGEIERARKQRELSMHALSELGLLEHPDIPLHGASAGARCRAAALAV